MVSLARFEVWPTLGALAAFGVAVVLIEPGPIRSHFADRAMQEISRYRGNAASPYAPCYARAERVQRTLDGFAAGPGSVARAIASARESLVTCVRGRLMARWNLTGAELPALITLVASQMELSLERLHSRKLRSFAEVAFQ